LNVSRVVIVQGPLGAGWRRMFGLLFGASAKKSPCAAGSVSLPPETE
jgi:hypothetical protein